MNRILAIEPDADRGVLLRQLLRESLNADLVLATSTEAAITAMTENQPDLILTSMLLAADEEQELVAHLRATPALRYLPVLTIPAVTDLSTTETRSSGLFSRLLRRRQPEVWQSYDFSAVITRIEEALEQSKIAVAQAEEEAEDEVAAAPIVESPVSLLPVSSVLRAAGSEKRAPRWTMSDLPWLSNVRLSWGQHLRLLNISSSGLLVESGVRLSPGSKTSFKIGGPDLDLIVPARVVRCRVADVDALGVRYEAAAVFDQPVETLMAAEEESVDPVVHLATLVTTVQRHAASGILPAELRATFEAGVLDLIMAREVRLRDVPVAENDGRESVYFTIPTSDDSHAVLQVTFNSNDQPGAEDFDVLVAAAEAASRVLALTGTTRQTIIRPQMPVKAATTLHVVGGTSTAPRKLQIA
jgi:CheY-like chemotaxis protein